MPTWSCGLQFRIVDGPGKGRTLPFDSPNVSIGRARTPGDRAEGWVLLNDDTVSRVHAELIWDEERMTYLLQHKSQTNLTTVNEQQTEEALLAVGDRIKMGSTVLELQQADTRFAGAAKGPAAKPAAATAKPAPAIPAFRTPTMDTEKIVKGPARVAALTQRPDFVLEVTEGPDRKKSFPITGLTITLGGIHEDSTPQKKDSGAWYNQEVEINDPALAPQCLALSWKEMQGGFNLWRPPHAGTRVKVTRDIDGVNWTTTLDDTPVLVKAGDLIEVAASVIRLKHA